MRCLTFFPTKSSKSGILHLEHISVQTSHIQSAQEAHVARGPGMGWHIRNVSIAQEGPMPLPPSLHIHPHRGSHHSGFSPPSLFSSACPSISHNCTVYSLLCLASFTQHNVSEIDLCYYLYSDSSWQLYDQSDKKLLDPFPKWLYHFISAIIRVLILPHSE